MATSLNKVMLIGNLGKDAETRQTAGGTSVASFSLATTYRIKDQSTGEFTERTDWHDVVLFRGDRVAPYLTKGKKVFVEGRLQTRSWEDQNGQKRYRTEVICDSFGLMLLGGRDGEGSSGRSDAGRYGRGSSGGYSQSGSQRESPPPPPQDSGGSMGSERSEPRGGGFDSSSQDDDIPF